VTYVPEQRRQTGRIEFSMLLSCSCRELVNKNDDRAAYEQELLFLMDVIYFSIRTDVVTASFQYPQNGE
jgi:hypothetical protein